jgi:hypothetical protein
MGTHLKKLIAIVLLPLLAFANWQMDFDELWATAGGWSNPYITDGLIAMWDGEWNAGGGKHDATATVWKDLIGTLNIPLTNNYSFSDNSVGHSVKSSDVLSCIIDIGSNATVSCVRKIIDTKSASYPTFSFSQSETSIFGENSSGYGISSSASWLNILPGYSFVSRDANALSFASVTYTIKTTQLDSNYNGTQKISKTLSMSIEEVNRLNIGGMLGDIYTFRIYNRALTASEIAQNYAIDKARFGL